MAKSDSGETKVRRYSVSDSGKATKKSDKPSRAPKTRKSNDQREKRVGPIGYFKGAWRELREVRWPNRAATWKLTVAVLLFTLVLTLFVVALDLLFDYLTKRILL